MPAKRKVAVSSSQHAVRVPRKKLAQLVAFVASRQHARVGEVDIAVVTDREIARLNRSYLGRRGSTDVLSFDLSGAAGSVVSAQIVVSGQTAAREAARRGHGPQLELMLYVVHALLHLLGYDDATAPQAERMHAREDELLEQFRARKRPHPRR